MSERPILRATGLTRRFGIGPAAVEAVRGVDLEVRGGCFVAIVGPSGSGKSTLMHLLAGLDRPTSGSVWVDGTDVTTLGDRELTLLRRDRVGFVFQFFNLLPVLSVHDNVILPLRLAGRGVDAERVTALIEAVGLGERRHHRPSELSGGEQQRVAVARALVTRPAVVFADEPTGNLDSRASADVLALLRRAVDEYQQTIVMVTHDPYAASQVDRVLALADGRVVEDVHPSSARAVADVMRRSR